MSENDVFINAGVAEVSATANQPNQPAEPEPVPAPEPEPEDDE